MDLVKASYERDEISRQAPGRKDVVIIRGAGGTQNKIQARHLNMSINEVYALFTDANLTIKIGKRKFAELRPKHVLPSSQLPCNVCLWKYHENSIIAVNNKNIYKRCLGDETITTHPEIIIKEQEEFYKKLY